MSNPYVKPPPRYRVARYELTHSNTFTSWHNAVTHAMRWYDHSGRAAYIEVTDIETGSREATFGDKQ